MRICLDFGHGGHNVGASSNGVHEKHIAFQYGKLAKDFLEYEGYEVILTRRDDTFIPLRERSNISNRNNCDIFISCHVNGASSEQANGIETIHFPNSTNGIKLAKYLNKQLVNNLEWNDRGIKSDEDLGRRLTVLRATKAPAVIIEPGFVSNAEEREFMQTPMYRCLVGQAILKGVKEYEEDIRNS